MAKKRARKKIYMTLFYKYIDVLEEDTTDRRLREIENKLAKLGFRIEIPEEDRQVYDKEQGGSGTWYAVNIYLCLNSTGEAVEIKGSTTLLPPKPEVPQRERIIGVNASEANRFFAIMHEGYKQKP